MLFGWMVLLFCWLLGEALSTVLHLPIPGTVLGMLLLLLFSFMRHSVEPRVAQAGSGLLAHLALFFVPAGVGVMEHAPLLAREGWAMLVVLVLSTLITMMVTALTLKWLVQRWGRTE